MKITDPGLRNRILEAIGDPDTPKILLAIRAAPKNAQTISEESGIPLSSVYRKLTALKAAGLAFASTFEITPEGKRQELLLSAVQEVRLGVAGAAAEVELIPTEESAKRLWFRMFTH